MKIASLAIAILMMSSMFSVGVFAEEIATPETENAIEAKVVGASPITFRAVQERAGTVSSVEATETLPNPAGFGDVEEVIAEVEGIIPEAKRVGFVTASFAKGFLVDESSNHLALIEGIWARVSVTTSEDARDARVVASGRLRVDNEVYKLVKNEITENSVEFDIVDPDEKTRGRLSLDLVGTYDEGHRKLWSGELKIGDVEGEVTLATIERSVRKASDKEIQEVPIGRFEKKNFVESTSTDNAMTEDRAIMAESNRQDGIIAWLRRTFG